MKAYEELEIFPALVPIESSEIDSQQRSETDGSKSEPAEPVSSHGDSNAEASKTGEKQEESTNAAGGNKPGAGASAGGLGAGSSVPPGMTLRQGLSTIGSLVVDYRGSRVAVQAVMPGILEKPQDEQLKYLDEIHCLHVLLCCT